MSLIKNITRTNIMFGILIVTCFLNTGCSVNPATGKKEFTPFLPQSSEKEIGQKEHTNVSAEFGGEYNNAKIKKYIQKVANKVTSASELPANYYHVTVLNSPIVNAFALPGGYLYITRGLLALANTEAEVAGVLGHESGHVTARHAASRSNTQMLSNIGAVLIGAATGSQEIAKLAGVGAQGIVASYSRGDEDEADMLGVRYLAKSGYNPYAQANFLRSLKLESDMQASLQGQNPDAGFDFFSTHPDTGGRVKKATDYAKSYNITNGEDGRMTHLQAIDGMIWGDDPEQGLVRGTQFLHPALRFAFTVPNGFSLNNQSDAVYAKHNSGAMIKFDIDSAKNASMAGYLQNEFAKDIQISDLRSVKFVNSKDGATALAQIQTQAGIVPARLYVLRGNDNMIYRFIMTSGKNNIHSFEQVFLNTAQSLRNLSASEAAKIKPYYIRLYQIKSGDSLEKIAQNLPIKTNAINILRVLNGLAPNDILPQSGYIKIISSK